MKLQASPVDAPLLSINQTIFPTLLSRLALNCATSTCLAIAPPERCETANGTRSKLGCRHQKDCHTYSLTPRRGTMPLQNSSWSLPSKRAVYSTRQHFTWQVNVRQIIAAWRVRQHWPWIFSVRLPCLELPQLHFQFGVYFYLAACKLDLL